MSWLQQKDQPLCPDLLWSKPVTKRGAGKLLIIGGNAMGFAYVAQTYSDAVKAGAGHIRAVVPDSLEKLTRGLEFIEYAPSNPSGGFAKSALAPLLELASWSDGVLLAGDLAKNSETTQLLDTLLSKCPSVITIDHHALTSLGLSTADLLASDHRVVIWTRHELQRAVVELKSEKLITSASTQENIAETLQLISDVYPAHLVLLEDNVVWIASDGKVISTPTSNLPNSSLFGIWALQNPTKIKEALACAAWELH